MLVFPGISRTLTEVLGRGIRANDPRISAGYPARKLPLGADFSFLNLDFPDTFSLHVPKEERIY